jgi:hypothetical protein
LQENFLFHHSNFSAQKRRENKKGKKALNLEKRIINSINDSRSFLLFQEPATVDFGARLITKKNGRKKNEEKERNLKKGKQRL